MPDPGHFGLTYEMLFIGDGNWTDITSLVDSRMTKVDIAGCSESLKSVISKCTFEMKYARTPAKTAHSTIVGKIISSKESGDIVKFRMGGIASFVGKVDFGSFSQKNGRIPGFVTITVEDNSYLLDENMPNSFEYPENEDLNDEGYAVFDKSNPAESIVMLRLLDAGYTVGDIDTENSDSITEKVRRVVYDSDYERTYREFIDTLLFEHCAVLYTTPEGKLSVKRLYRDEPTSERTVDDFIVEDGINTSGGDYYFDGVKIVWSNLGRLDGAVVYNANITISFDSEGNREGEEIQPEHYWPENGDIEETWQEFNATFLDREYQTKISRLKNKDLSLISVKNAYYEVDKDTDIILANNPPEIEPTKARVLFYNKNATDAKKLYGFTIVGNALFRNKLNESTYPIDAKHLDDPYESEFVFLTDTAEQLANHLHRFRKYGDLRHKWSEIDVVTPMFQVLTVSAPDTLISSLAMVISQTITFPAPNKIKRSNSAIGITPFNSEPVKTSSLQVGGSPTNTGPAGTSGVVTVVQYCLGTYDEPTPVGDSVVGDETGVVGDETGVLGETGWSFTRPTPGLGEYVWMRVGSYTPPEEWPSEWQDIRVTGSDARGLRLSASALTIPVTSRGVVRGEDITLIAELQNISSPAEGITWNMYPSDAITMIDTDPVSEFSKIIDVSTLESGIKSFYVEIVCEFLGVTYHDRVQIDVVADGLPAPCNFGGVTEVPSTTPDGEPLVAGDYFLWATTTTASYTKGEIYEYDGTGWVLSSNGNLVMTMFDDFADLANDVEETVIGHAVIKKLVAIEAWIEYLMTKDLTITSDGKIATADFAESEQGVPTSGFMLDNPVTPSGRRGRIRSYGGIFNNATVYGSLIHDALQTRNEAPATAKTFPAKTAWNRKNFWTNLSVTENSADMLSVDLNIGGTSYDYIRKITSAAFEKEIVSYQDYVYDSEADLSDYYTSPGKGSINIDAETSFVAGSYPVQQYVYNPATGQWELQWVYIDYVIYAEIKIYVDDVLKATFNGSDSHNISIDVNKGSSIRIRRTGEHSSTIASSDVTASYGIDWVGIQNSLQYSNVTDSWDTIELMDSDYLVRDRWQLASPALDSNNYIAYALANSFIGLFSDLPEGVEIEADDSVSTLTYNGLADEPITAVINNGNSVTLVYGAGSKTFVSGVNADGSFTGWYNASASISVLIKEGIVVSNVIPKDSSREIGEYGNPFYAGYFDNLSLGGMPMYACRAWVNFDGVGTLSVRGEQNVSSVTDNGTGDYTINFENDMEDTAYAVVAGFSGNDSSTRTDASVINVLGGNVGYVRVLGLDCNTQQYQDLLDISVVAFR